MACSKFAAFSNWHFKVAFKASILIQAFSKRHFQRGIFEEAFSKQHFKAAFLD
jgi:hypothetical protein